MHVHFFGDYLNNRILLIQLKSSQSISQNRQEKFVNWCVWFAGMLALSYTGTWKVTPKQHAQDLNTECQIPVVKQNHRKKHYLPEITGKHFEFFVDNFFCK